MLAQIERQLRHEELISGHDEGNVMCNEPMTIMIVKSSGRQDDDRRREMASKQIAMLCNSRWRVIEVGTCDHQDAFTVKDAADNKCIALIQKAGDLRGRHGLLDFQRRLRHIVDIAAKRVEDPVLVGRELS